MNLLIVESPNKAKKIAKILGNNWKVMASVGHIRDLPKKEIGVNPPDFKPKYIVNDKSKIILKNLQTAVANASKIYLATDPDREGEAIAWHLEKSLRLKNPIRVSFQEITTNAVLKAIQTPSTINYPLVKAQEARRVLDRLVGYMVSPALSNYAQQKLSAGRVQSVALRLVVEREREIENFVVTQYFIVRVYYKSNSINWFADWNTKAMLPKDKKYLTDKTLASALVKLRQFNIVSIDQKESKSFAPPPFTTSTLQQAASVSLKINPKQTMQLAQKLFEEGLITYHRTDSNNLSQDAINAIRAWLSSHSMSAEIPNKPNTWKNKANSQEAHEAIRPTTIDQRTISLHDPQAEKLYQLIWERAVASQMKPALFDVTIVNLLSVDKVDNKHQAFISKGKVLQFAGWLKLTEDKTQESENEAEDDQKLPALNSGDSHTAYDGKILDKETKPLPRYTEASLIKKLDNEGIGRPSTYASILDNIKNRQYIDIIKRKIHAAILGKTVNDVLVNKFAFMELIFTKDLEAVLDKVATGQEKYLPTVANFYAQLTMELKQMVINDIYAPIPQNPDQPICPECGKPLRQLTGKNHKQFWGCTGYPECKITLPDIQGQPGAKTVAEKRGVCPDCGAPMIKRTSTKGNKGVFWGCSAFPKCKTILPDNGGEPGKKVTVEQGADCSECGQPMLKRSGKKGAFWGCSAYPKCKNTASV